MGRFEGPEKGKAATGLPFEAPLGSAQGKQGKTESKYGFTRQ
jgi:hypothetical protein